MSVSPVLLSLTAGVFLNGHAILNTSSYYSSSQAVLQADAFGYWQTPGVCYTATTWSGDSRQNILHSSCQHPTTTIITPTTTTTASSSSSSSSNVDDLRLTTSANCATSCFFSPFADVDSAEQVVRDCYDDLPSATDGDASYTASTLQFLETDASAYLKVRVEPPKPVSWLAVRARWSDDVNATLIAQVVENNNDNVTESISTIEVPLSRELVSDVTSTVAMPLVPHTNNTAHYVREVTVVFNRSTSSSDDGSDSTDSHAQIHELAAFSEPCFDELVLDLHALYNVSHIYLNVYSDNLQQISVDWSVDGQQFGDAVSLSVNHGNWNTERTLTAQDVLTSSNHSGTRSRARDSLIARFVRVKLRNEFKAVFRGIRVFGWPLGNSSSAAQNDVCLDHSLCSSHGDCERSTNRCQCDHLFQGENCSLVNVTQCDSRQCCLNLAGQETVVSLDTAPLSETAVQKGFGAQCFSALGKRCVGDCLGTRSRIVRCFCQLDKLTR